MLVDLRHVSRANSRGKLALFGVGDETSARPAGAVDVLDRRFGCGAVAAVSAAHQARNGEHSGKQEGGS